MRFRLRTVAPLEQGLFSRLVQPALQPRLSYAETRPRGILRICRQPATIRFPLGASGSCGWAGRFWRASGAGKRFTTTPAQRGPPEQVAPARNPVAENPADDSTAELFGEEPVLPTDPVAAGQSATPTSEPTLAEPELAEPELAEPTLAEPTPAEPILAEPELADPSPATEPSTPETLRTVWQLGSRWSYAAAIAAKGLDAEYYGGALDRRPPRGGVVGAGAARVSAGRSRLIAKRR